ncbi:hypothetical protein MSLAZ_0611 [Methanosarcina lacustris Z-7289]|uniref:Uncharacterized protein n=1 Tax=Methanosarcina lacustris Z-7289 TaxID=1434111 RepID=A0A0E3S416_9EURY|nr:hypothetical protein [Methanosarcina lacustris]AKB73872.1 hypothetical protein MSLAZ_0611 [Methanosarcina lacustris Z-7289]
METGEGKVFLLTKPPGSPRSELCLSLIVRAGKRGNPTRLYLAGDGVYHLLGGNLPACKVYACKEDLEARGIRTEGRGTEGIRTGAELTIPEAFYETFTEDLMEHCEKVYTF